MSDSAPNMKISDRGLAIIKQFEVFRATAYLCPAGIPTIGYGHTGADVTKSDVGVKTITEAEATELLRRDVITAEKALGRRVKVPLTQNQFDALCSFTYNLGEGNLASSTLLKLLNSGDYDGACQEFVKWNKVNKIALPGLTRRREAEAALFAEA